MNKMLDTIRKLRVRRSTIYLCMAWVALFVLYLGVRPEPAPRANTTAPVVAPTTTRAPSPTRTVEPTTEATTTETATPTETTVPKTGEYGQTGRAPTTTTVAPLIPPELVPPGLIPTTQSPQTTPQPR